MRIIKKYSNRRLYDTTASAYVNLEELARLVQDGESIQVSDAATGEDLTRQVLLQVILEARGGIELLPPGLLHRVIRYSGDQPWQRVALRQLAGGFEVLDAQITAFERQLGMWKRDAPPPAEFVGEPQPPPYAARDPQAPPPPEKARGDVELDELRQRLAALEERLGRPAR